MKIKPLMFTALAALPLLAGPVMAQSATSESTTTSNSGAAMPRPPTPQQAPAAQGGTDGTGAGESSGSH